MKYEESSFNDGSLSEIVTYISAPRYKRGRPCSILVNFFSWHKPHLPNGFTLRFFNDDVMKVLVHEISAWSFSRLTVFFNQVPISMTECYDFATLIAL